MHFWVGLCCILLCKVNYFDSHSLYGSVLYVYVLRFMDPYMFYDDSYICFTIYGSVYITLAICFIIYGYVYMTLFIYVLWFMDLCISQYMFYELWIYVSHNSYIYFKIYESVFLICFMIVVFILCFNSQYCRDCSALEKLERHFETIAFS